MLVKKMPQTLKKPKKAFRVKPKQTTEEEHKAIVEVGFSNIPKLKLNNPFIERQEKLASENKNNQFVAKDLIYFKDIRQKEKNAASMERRPIHPQFSSTFNVTLPFKDTLLDLTPEMPPNQGISTIYNGTPREARLLEKSQEGHNFKNNSPKKFMFNPEKARVAVKDTRENSSSKEVKKKVK